LGYALHRFGLIFITLAQNWLRRVYAFIQT